MKPMKLKLLLLLIVAGPAFSFGQTKTISHGQQTWLGYFNQTRLSNKWELSTDLNLRTREHFTSGLYQSLIRFGVSYYLNDAAKFTAGYALVNYFPGYNHKYLGAPEHRPWEQFQWQTKYAKKLVQQKIRLEERYRHKLTGDTKLAPGYNFNWRLRYYFNLEIPLNKKAADVNAFSFIAGEEVNVNFGKKIVYNYFDQNKIYAGLKYKFSPSNNLQVGFMNVFQQLAVGNSYKSTNVIRIYYYQNIDLRKKKDF